MLMLMQLLLLGGVVRQHYESRHDPIHTFEPHPIHGPERERE